MAILSKLPAAVAVAALTATLVGCGSSDVRDERDQALMERDEAQTELDQTQAERDQAQADLEAAQAEAEAAQAELEAAQAEAAEQLEMERMRAEEAAAEAAAAAEQELMEAEQARMEEEAARMEAESERDALQEAADEATSAADIATAKELLASLVDMDPDRDPDGTGPLRRRPLGYTAADSEYLPTRADPNPDTFPVLGGTLYTRNALVDLATGTPDPTPAEPVADADAANWVYSRTVDTTIPAANVPAVVTASSGGEVGVSVTGYTQTDTVPDMIEDFRGVELTQGTKGMTPYRQAWVYTDIEDATAGAGAGVLDASYHFTSVPGVKTYSVDPRVARTGAGTAFDSDAAGTISTAIPWSDVTRIGSAVTTVGATGAGQVVSFEGSVKGLAGTFSCTIDATVTTCTPPATNSRTGVVGDIIGGDTVTGANDGFVTDDDSTAASGAPVGIWTFVLDPELAADVMDDDGYLAFGWWLHKRGDDQPSGEQMNVATFAQTYDLAERMPDPGTPAAKAATAHVAGNGALLTGTATYSGGAAGKYAIVETTTDHAQGGHFTAKATFTADFDADSDGNSGNGNDNDGIKLTGMIDEFMTGDMARDWTVSLAFDANTTTSIAADGTVTYAPVAGSVPADADPDAIAAAATVRGLRTESPTVLDGISTGGTCVAGSTGNTCRVASATWNLGGAAPGKGSWSATYYGGSKETDLPTAIIGTFGAGLGSVARIAGAFGANMDMEEEAPEN